MQQLEDGEMKEAGRGVQRADSLRSKLEIVDQNCRVTTALCSGTFL